MVLPTTGGTTLAGTEAPKGTIQLHPADERRREIADQLVRERQAYHVTKTPQQFINDGTDDAQQEWSVMPDIPSGSPNFKPVSKHKTKELAVAECDRLSGKKPKEEPEEIAARYKKASVGRWMSADKAAVWAWTLMQNEDR